MDTIITLPYCKVEMHLVNVMALVYVKCRVIYRGHGKYKSKKKIISLKTWKQKKKKNLKTPEITLKHEVNKIRKAKIQSELQLASGEANQEGKI